MLEMLEGIENRYDEVTMLLSDPSVISDQSRYPKLLKEHSDLEEIVAEIKKYRQALEAIEEAKEMLASPQDADFKELLQAELKENTQLAEQCKETLTIMLQPKDPNDDRSVIVEMRAGAGGEEAALFVANLYRAYSMYAEKQGWCTEIIDVNATEIGGYKEIVFNIDAVGAFSRLKFESGVHRVQRVPETESSGRIHTSTITVAVLPEVDDVDVDINPNDLEIDTFRASGAGGQHINKTDSAIRITHKPTGLVVTCQDQRSQYKNKDKAMAVLRSRLYDMALKEQTDELTENRRSQVGTGDRSERIRTYNFPQGRVTDHRIGLTLYKLDQIMDGDFDEVFNALSNASRAGQLGSGDSSDD